MTTDPTEPMGDEEFVRRFMSHHAFDGYGPVPPGVVEAARSLARLRLWYLRSKPEKPLPAEREINELFAASAIQAEWMRELYEARDDLRSRLDAAEARAAAAEGVVKAARPFGDYWIYEDADHDLFPHHYDDLVAALVALDHEPPA